MLEFTTTRFGKPRRIDVHNLPIEKTLAHRLPQEDLYRSLKRLGIPGISPTMSHQDLSLVYGDWLQSRDEAAK
jgi:hypothetical protein